jgi:hypothetical protein
MKSVDNARNWLGIYFLGTTAALGVYILLFAQTKLLPVSSADAASAFKIIIPMFVAQLTIAFKWIASPPTNVAAVTSIPRWAVIGPPIIVDAILIITITYLIIDQGSSADAGQTFINVVTFCVTLLSASTVFIVAVIFAAPSGASSPTADGLATQPQGAAQKQN